MTFDNNSRIAIEDLVLFAWAVKCVIHETNFGPHLYLSNVIIFTSLHIFFFLVVVCFIILQYIVYVDFLLLAGPLFYSCVYAFLFLTLVARCVRGRCDDISNLYASHYVFMLFPIQTDGSTDYVQTKHICFVYTYWK